MLLLYFMAYKPPVARIIYVVLCLCYMEKMEFSFKKVD